MNTISRATAGGAVGVLALSLALTSCASDGGNGVSGGASGDAIVIGHAADFSSDYAGYDAPMRAGAELAVEEINAAGGIDGRQISYRPIDGRNDQAETLRATEELIDEGAVYLIGTTSSPWTAQANVACADGIPISTGDGTSSSLVADGGECAFQVILSDNIQGAAAAEFALEQGWKTAVTMSSPDDPYTLTVPEYFTETYEELGGTVASSVDFRLGAGDYSVQATAIANLPEQPDVIFTPIFLPDAPIFMRQLRAQGVETPVLGADGAVDAATLDAGPAVEGMYATYHAWPADGGGDRLTQFVEAYTDFHGSAPESMVAGLGYDEIYMIKEIIESEGEATPEAVTAGLLKLDFEGVTGHVQMDPETRISRKDVAIVRVVEGEFRLIENLMPIAVPEV